MAWLDGKRALVVGAGSGIGRAVVTAFQEEGAQVGALELSPDKAGRLAAESPGCLVRRGDATRVADARAAVNAVTGAFGGLDVLVNCVGIFDFYRGIADIDDDQLDGAFDEIFAVNVKSQLACVRAALPGLTPRSITSRSGLLAELRKVREAGCAVTHEESDEGVASVAIAVRGRQHVPVAALVVSAPLSRMTEETTEKIKNELREQAAWLEDQLPGAT